MGQKRKNTVVSSKPQITNEKKQHEFLSSATGLAGVLVTACLGLCGVVITASLGFWGIRTQVTEPIHATQTAEAKLTQIASSHPSIVASQTITVPPATNTGLPRYTASPSPTTSPIRLDVKLTGGPTVGKIYLGDPKIPLDTKIEKMGDTLWIYDFNLLTLLTNTQTYLCNPYGEINLEVGVINISKDEMIRFENAPLITITSVEAVTFEQNVHVIAPESAGGGVFRDYSFDLDKRKLGSTSQASPLDSSSIPDFYTLQAGEQEWLKITIECNEPGKYKVKPGIKFTYKGRESILWDDQDTLITSLETYYSWTEIVSPNIHIYSLDGLIQWDDLTNEWNKSVISAEQWLSAQD